MQLPCCGGSQHHHQTKKHLAALTRHAEQMVVLFCVQNNVVGWLGAWFVVFQGNLGSFQMAMAAMARPSAQTIGYISQDASWLCF